MTRFLNACDIRRAVCGLAAVVLVLSGGVAAQDEGLVLSGGVAAQSEGFLLAKTYRDGLDLSQYLVSEKLDGVRAQWDGGRLVSRNGHTFAAPDWFVAEFPAVRLDGELWAGRGTFERLSGIVRRQKSSKDGWREVRFMVFDAPDADGPFTERLQTLQRLVREAGVAHLQVVAHSPVESEAQLQRRMQAVVAAGGEGLMLRRKDSAYRGGRSDDLIKLKPHTDAEARVVAHHPAKEGKYTGLTGAVTVETADGLRFRIGTGFSDQDRHHPPPIGSVITYRYQGFYQSGIPRHPVFLRVRNDEP